MFSYSKISFLVYSAGILSAGTKNGFAFALENAPLGGISASPNFARSHSQVTMGNTSTSSGHSNSNPSPSISSSHMGANSLIIDEMNKQKWRNR